MSETRGNEPAFIKDERFRYDNLKDGNPMPGKKNGKLPAMGWNSWNAFGSGNTEALTRTMADRLLELGLADLGYRYVVLDDGCYVPERVNGHLQASPEKFPSGFRALADDLHAKGLKFGMYNDVGTKLCSGASVGTCGYEEIDAEDYAAWDIDFIKVDNCYYPWDNATFSNAENARYTYAPKIRSIRICNEDTELTLSAVKDGVIKGNGAGIVDDYVFGIGTLDGTGPEHSPAGDLSSELTFIVNLSKAGDYSFEVEYATGKEAGIGEWLELAVGEDEDTKYIFDAFLPESPDADTFVYSIPMKVTLKSGNNLIRIMNHRRQENTLISYTKVFESLRDAAPEKDLVLSLCEWGKTQPHEWGYKVGYSWRILNDITFQVGSDGNPGNGTWNSDYTTGVTAQYNKAVIMDEFSGLDKGWNDPDMLMVGMNGLDETMNRTHFTLWCMLNAPLMLGLDLRRVEKGDAIHKIISRKELIALNQDPLGIQAKRVYTTAKCDEPDKDYIRDNDRVDVLVKPLADGSLAVTFVNLGENSYKNEINISAKDLLNAVKSKAVHAEIFENAASFEVIDLWTEDKEKVTDGICVKDLAPHDQKTFRIYPAE